MEKARNLRDQPCCGYFLQGGVRAVAMIDVGISLFAMILIASECVQRFPEWVEMKKVNLTLYYVRAILWASYFAHKIIIIGLSVFLFKSARRRNDRMCKMWIILTILINIILVLEAVANEYLFKIGRIVLVFLILYIFYKIYCIHVVFTYIREIRSYGGFNVCLSGLTDAEVEEFEKGNPPEVNEMKDQLSMVKLQAFNQDFEIPVNKLEIDENTPLGSGAFGTVYRAKLLIEEPPRTVAVKTIHPNADAMYFKTLLAELKIMTFLSPHENVVNLIGACTSQIKDKKLFIVVEFCPYGNLHDFLKARRGLFVNYVKNGELTGFQGDLYQNVNTSNSLTTANLIKFAYETAKGMEFLEDKKVVHSDLAARNVLLAYGKIAKITDFGLSKKLYQYTNYVHKQDKLLPWRWMALESLKDMTFSSKSDVWSYAVCIWEIFSLGEVPYPGFNWNLDFITLIVEGLRMTQPPNSTNEIYELMLKCWHIEIEMRPSFSEIRKLFEEKYVQVKDAYSSVDMFVDGQTQPVSLQMEDEVEVYIGNDMLSCSSTYDSGYDGSGTGGGCVTSI